MRKRPLDDPQVIAGLEALRAEDQELGEIAQRSLEALDGDLTQIAEIRKDLNERLTHPSALAMYARIVVRPDGSIDQRQLYTLKDSIPGLEGFQGINGTMYAKFTGGREPVDIGPVSNYVTETTNDTGNLDFQYS